MAQQSTRPSIDVAPNSFGGLITDFLRDVEHMNNDLSPPRRAPAPTARSSATAEWWGLPPDPTGANFPRARHAGPYLVQLELFCLPSFQPGSLAVHRKVVIWSYDAGENWLNAMRAVGREARRRAQFVVAAVLNVIKMPRPVAQAPSLEDFDRLMLSLGGLRMSSFVQADQVCQMCDCIYADKTIFHPLHRLGPSSFQQLRSELARELARLVPDLTSAARFDSLLPLSTDSDEAPGAWEGFVPGEPGPGPTSDTCPAAALQAEHKLDENYWPEIAAYLRSPGSKCPHVRCIFCFAELVCPPLQQPASDREPMLKLPCLHVVGKTCAQAWFSSQTQRGRPAQCPACRSDVADGAWKE